MADLTHFDIPQEQPLKPNGDFNPPSWTPLPPATAEQRAYIDEGAAMAVEQLQQKRASIEGDNGARWTEWQNQCGQRKQWIEGKRATVERLKQQRVEALQQFNTYWDTLINTAKSDYTAAKAYPVPPRPA